MIRRSLIALITMGAMALAAVPRDAAAQGSRLEYRVVHASPYELERLIADAGRDGFTCVSVARPEVDVKLPGVVVILARPYIETTYVPKRVTHRVVRVQGSGGELAGQLERNAGEGYRLCGVALAEASPGPVLVAVMSPEAERPAGGRHYAAEVLGSAERAARLASLGRDGFVPVAATSINDNRVVEQRNWMVVAEQTAARPVEIVVRSRPGPDALAKAIVEQSQQGFIGNLIWKQGLSAIVVVMSRVAGETARPVEHELDTIDPRRLDGLSGVYVGDVPWLSDGQRVVLTVKERSATTYAVTDTLPAMGARGYASLDELTPLGAHLGGNRVRDRARAAASSVRRGPKGEPILHTVLTQSPR